MISIQLNWIIPNKCWSGYAIWTDLETVGMVNGSVLPFGEPVDVPRVVCVGFIAAGSQAKAHPGDRPRGLLPFFKEETPKCAPMPEVSDSPI